jgi:hypothetical protein
MTDDKLLTAKELRGSGVSRMKKRSYIPLARPNSSALPSAKTAVVVRVGDQDGRYHGQRS